MNSLVGFELDIWDYATFVTILLLVLSGIVFYCWLAGLPGRIAIARRHPEAEAVNMMGWLGFVAIVPWVQAFIWAFKPTDVVDLRYGPRQVRRETAEQIARLTGRPVPETALPAAAPEPHKE